MFYYCWLLLDLLKFNLKVFFSVDFPKRTERHQTRQSNTSASYLDLLLSIEREGQLHTSIYDKRNDFNIHITYFTFVGSNIPHSSTFGVFISQVMQYARACFSCGYLFWGRCFFPITFSNRDTSWTVCNCHWWSSPHQYRNLLNDVSSYHEIPRDILKFDHIQ